MSDELRSPFPEYDVLDKWDTPSWNEQTRRVILQRLHQVPERCFFEPEEWATLEAVCDRLIPQPDRPDWPVPIVPWIDQKLYENQSEGYRYAGMPPLQKAWREGLRGIDDESVRRFQKRFRDLPAEQQDHVLARIQRGEVESEVWQGLPPQRFFTSMLLHQVVSIYYAHPAAWSEIGFGGPASPRGYVRLGANRRDPWEARKSNG